MAEVKLLNHLKKTIKSFLSAPNAESDEVKKSEQKFEESIDERRKLRGQKLELNKIITEKYKIISKDLSKKYFYQFESLSDMQKNCLKHKMHKKIKNYYKQSKMDLYV